jgi:hypothetical protein
MKSIQFNFLSGIQIFYPLLMEMDFFLVIRCSKELAGRISLKSKVPRFSSEFSLISTHRNFLNFNSNFNSNLDQFL